MFKKLISTAILATLPMVALNADNNQSKQNMMINPFEDDPFFKDFQKIQADMDRLMQNFRSHSMISTPKMSLDSPFSSGFSSNIKTDVNDKGDYYEVIADLPGMEKAKINVKAEKGMLSISAKNDVKKEKKKENKIIQQERFIGSFYRSMSLPKDADEAKISSDYKNGVLTVKIPKKKK